MPAILRQSVDAEMKSAFAPTGVLRAAINLGNPILANTDPDTGEPGGVSVDLARALVERLGVGLELLVVDAADQSVQAVAAEQADVGFFAVDPERGAQIAFTAAYVLIEGAYLVKEDAAFHNNSQVDQPGIRVVVGKGSAYDLYLSRTLQQAEIVRAPTSPAVVDAFLEQGMEVAAGVKQQLEADAGRLGGLRLLPDRFMVIRQAMGLPKSRGDAAARYLAAFVEEMKQSGRVKAALERHGVHGASVAPPGE